MSKTQLELSEHKSTPQPLKIPNGLHRLKDSTCYLSIQIYFYCDHRFLTDIARALNVFYTLNADAIHESGYYPRDNVVISQNTSEDGKYLQR